MFRANQFPDACIKKKTANQFQPALPAGDYFRIIANQSFTRNPFRIGKSTHVP